MTNYNVDEEGYILDIPKIPIDEDFVNMTFESIDNAILDCFTADNVVLDSEDSFNGEHYD